MGSVIIDTTLNNSGFERGYAAVLASTRRFVNSVATSVSGVEKSFTGTTAAIMRQQAAVDDLRAKMKALSEYETQKTAYEEKAAEVRKLGAELGWSNEKVKELNAEMQRMIWPAQPKESAEQLASKLAIAEQRLSEMQSKAQQVGHTAPKAMRDTGRAAQTAAKHTNAVGSGIERLVKRIKNLVSAVLVFQVIRTALRGMRDYFATAIKANQDFVNSFGRLKGSMQTAFQPVLDFVIPILTQLIKWINTAMQYVIAFFSVISGKSIKSMQDSAKAMNQLGSATDKAGKSAKRAIAPFDELIVLTENMSSSAEAASDFPAIFEELDGSSLDLSWLDTLKAALEPLRTWAMSEDGIPRLVRLLQEFWQGIDWATLNDSVYNLVYQLSRVGAFVFDSVIDFLEFFLIPLATWTMNEAFPRFCDITANMLAAIDWNKLNSALERMWQALLPLAKNVGEGLLWFYENVISPMVVWAGNALIPAVIDLVTEAIDALNTVIEIIAPHAKDLWDNFMVPLGEWTGDIIIKAINSVTDAFKKFSDWAKANPEKLKTIFDIITTFLAALWTYYAVKNVALFVTGTLIPALTSLGTTLATVWLPIAAITAGIIALAAVWDKLTPAQRTITLLGALAAAALAAAIAIAVFHTSWSIGIAAAAIVAGLALLAGAALFSGQSIPNMLTGATTESTSIPGSASSFAAKDFSSSPLPKLATGTVVPPNREFAAILGDNKNEPEIVSPLSTMKQAFKEAMAEGGSTDSPLMRRMVDLLEIIAEQDRNVVFTPSADAGRAITRSTQLYEAVTG